MTISDKSGRVGIADGRPNLPLEDLLRDFERFLGQMGSKEVEAEARRWLEALSREGLPQSESGRAKMQGDLVRLCVKGRLQPLLSAYGISHPSYNYFEAFEENARGPWDALPPTWQVPTPAFWSVLGFDVGLPIGVPASVLTTTSRWVGYYARRGFNVLTYKTVRSQERPAYLAPNWIFLNELDTPLRPGTPLPVAEGDESVWPTNSTSFSTANSFGVPSFKPSEWQADVARTLELLRSDQLLIVSVMGTWEDYQGEALVADFVRVAKMAEESGAPVIELNLSCPNTVDHENGGIKQRLICESPGETACIVRAVRAALKPETRLIIKLSYMPRHLLERVVEPLASEQLIDGVSAINTVQMAVRKPSGGPVFVGTSQDPVLARDLAGVSGVAIREYGLQLVRWLSEIRAKQGFRFDIIGMGGVMDASDVEAYWQAGAVAVQAATAAFFNPDLARQASNRLLGSAPMLENELAARSQVLGLLHDRPLTLREITRQLAEHEDERDRMDGLFDRDRLISEKARALLQRLEDEGTITASRELGKIVFRPVVEDRPVRVLEPVR